MVKENRTLNRFDIERIIKEDGIETPERLLDLLFGTHWNDYNSDFVIKNRWWNKPKDTIYNRLNMFWLQPLFMLCIPFRYVLYGNFYINRESKLGRLVTRLVGEF